MGGFEVLDKVICCYEDYVKLVNTSSSKANQWYAITLPRDTFWVKVFHSLSQGFKRLKGDSFTSYIHPLAPIKKLLAEAGFEEKASRNRREWKSLLFERVRGLPKA